MLNGKIRVELRVNLRRLKYFVKIVDTGSLTQASEILHIAQPALSQQLATLEHEFDQKLLLRTRTGVTPTQAGQVLYRHAQVMLRQFAQAQSDVKNSGRALSGQVSVGLAPGTAAASLALPLLKAMHDQHPEIVLHINENLGTTLCEVVKNGCMDMAVLYGGKRVVQGLAFDHLLDEELFVVAPAGMLPGEGQVTLKELRDINLLLPRSHNYLRQYVDEAFASQQMAPRVVAEIESSETLASAVASGVGATVLPVSAARTVAASITGHLSRIVSPTIEVPLALCASDHLPLSEPAQAVKTIVLELVEHLELAAGLHSIH
ncbi:nitrogen assimilation transcriptional regulator NAC [Polaromonas jejuensis]|uniref:Nitrogen assimilation transcriptional regulator NAC n=1 Tax=Polaromonas jejuensis TaxID=457502 RepID=A0ABW0Q534_9BURK